MTTSYDYNAAIRENGARSDKYFEAKAIGQFIQAFEPQLVRSKAVLVPWRVERSRSSAVYA